LILIKINQCSHEEDINKRFVRLEQDVSILLNTWHDFRKEFEKDTDDRLAEREINMEKNLNKKMKGKFYFNIEIEI